MVMQSSNPLESCAFRDLPFSHHVCEHMIRSKIRSTRPQPVLPFVFPFRHFDAESFKGFDPLKSDFRSRKRGEMLRL